MTTLPPSPRSQRRIWQVPRGQAAGQSLSQARRSAKVPVRTSVCRLPSRTDCCHDKSWTFRAAREAATSGPASGFAASRFSWGRARWAYGAS
nr:MAG TPA: hypothetical protein [Caudoviricetes sp.]